ncbi:MAG: SOS response-associated peptidase [Phycisphaeraceae bacterium]|nr:SOS response-associated peptidase [Phycisphaeraceae bacterium]MCW5764076.1 SOS response-associated peptidase [Phycisphaeraceae bacterium]
MCGRISLKTHPRVLAELFGVDIPLTLKPRYNIAPTQRTLVIRNLNSVREAMMGRWGYIPAWRKSGQKGPEPINARSETAGTSRLFGEPLRRRRCIIPASGFYEWQAIEGQRAKRPFHIEPVGSDVFALAGLWSRWQPHDADAVETFTILTCAPNEVMKPIHDRMPVILPVELIDAWLDPAIDDVSEVATMLRPASPAAIMAREVSTRVNSPKHDDELCIKPRPETDPGTNAAP